VKSSLDQFNEKTGAGEGAKMRRFQITRFSGQFNRRNGGGFICYCLTMAPGKTVADLSSGHVRILGCREDEIGPICEGNQSAIDAMSLPSEIIEAVAEVRRWRDSGEWYRTRQTPWTRG